MNLAHPTSLLAILVAAQANAAVDFDKQIRPVLEASCVQCHGVEKQKGGLRLDSPALAFKGGESGPAIIAGKPAESLFLKLVQLPKGDDDVMPPKGDPLTKEQVATFTQWIQEGANWPSNRVLMAKDKDTLERDKRYEAKPLVSLEVFPSQANLETSSDHQQFVALAKYSDDTTRDVTTEVNLQLAAEGIAKLEANKLTPLKDGNTQLHISYRDKKVSLPITVKDVSKVRPNSFRLDVMPVFMRAKCNTGSCHGSARGQDGFMLSLFGYDPEGDHFRITRELSSRRINLAIPEESLLIEKSIEAVPHTGGKLFEKGSVYYNDMLTWLKGGAKNDADDIPVPTGIEVLPRSLLLEGVGSTQQMTVVAKYSDGTDRDVTHLALFQGNNDNSASVTKDGLVTSNKRGEAFIMARFATFTVGSQVIVIPDNLQYTRPQVAETNYIDTLVNTKLHKLRIIPSGSCSDSAFIRRAFLDITGTLPEIEEQEKFIADQAPDKRAKLVDQLLGRKEFTEMWVMKFAELLQIRTQQNNQVSYKATLLYHNWLKEKIANNVPINKIVQEILSSTGGTFKNPPTNYYQIEKDTLKVAENAAQVFMGMRIQCAQCHNHPFDRWTMDDYYSFAAFFSQIGRKNAEDPREVIVYNSRGGEMKHIVSKKDMAPKFLGGETPEIARGTDRREVVAEWMASPKNPFFATNLANIVWQHFFGVGIIEPVDDVRVSNPASNPELLDELAKKFTEYNYDFKRLVRDICNSQTYQRTTEANESNESDTRNFARSDLRRLRAEVLLDVITQVTQTKNKFQGLPLGARAIQIADGNVSNYFLTTFGRATRETVCSCEVKMDPSLSQALHLLNGDVTHTRIQQGRLIPTMMKQEGQTHGKTIENIYQRTLCRKPSDNEAKPLLAMLEKEEKPEEQTAILEDVFWALLNSKEFMFNH
jgi:mono/diheme cytochrome c family protein